MKDKELNIRKDSFAAGSEHGMHLILSYYKDYMNEPYRRCSFEQWLKDNTNINPDDYE